MEIDREGVECAKINFENLETAFPIVKKHPMYIIAKAQLDEALGYKKVEESLAEHVPSSL